MVLSYVDGAIVPLPGQRCVNVSVDKRPHAPHSTLTHACKLNHDHGPGHRCLCGKAWS